MPWLSVQYPLTESPWAQTVVRYVQARLAGLVHEMARRRPRAAEAVIWLNTAWWGYVFTFHGDRLMAWAVFWEVERAGAPRTWGVVCLALVALALLGWLLRSQRLLRLWLIVSVAAYLFVGVRLWLSGQWYYPGSIYPFLLAGLALVAYLEIGVQHEPGAPA